MVTLSICVAAHARARMCKALAKNASQPVTCHPPNLSDLAERLARLAPSHRDPEHFHAEKSDIVAALRRLDRAPAGAWPLNPSTRSTGERA